MAYQVLARKLRPKIFNEVVGQRPIVQALKNAIIKKKIGHAYLFSGTRGVGKTTLARIFAKAIRCLSPSTDGNPCFKCLTCITDGQNPDESIDILEIDGASNNGVDHIRQLVENVQFLPSTGNYKVYIIDEVHMLSKEAFNALLKTLEAPPEHIIFLFATTEPEKIPDTILSRCQCYSLGNLLTDELENYLTKILLKEKIAIESDEIISILCLEANGSLRDALSLLEQVLTYSDEPVLTRKIINHALGLVDHELLDVFLGALYGGEVSKLSATFKQILSKNHVNLKKFCIEILDRIYASIEELFSQNNQGPSLSTNSPHLLSLTRAELYWIYETLAKDFTWSIQSIDPFKITEIVLQKVCLRREFFTPVKNNLNQLPNNENDKTIVTKNSSQTSSAPLNLEQDKLSKLNQNSWPNFLLFLREKAPTLYTQLRHAHALAPPSTTNSSISIHLGFDQNGRIFHHNLNETEINSKVKGLLAEFYNVPLDKVDLKIILLSDEDKKKTQFQSEAQKNEIAQKQKQEVKKQELMSDPMVMEMKKIFNTKTEKITLF